VRVKKADSAAPKCATAVQNPNGYKGGDTVKSRMLANRVYLIGIPAEISFQVFSLYLAQTAPSAWMVIARFLLGAT
jgi:hypothetical protein